MRIKVKQGIALGSALIMMLSGCSKEASGTVEATSKAPETEAVKETEAVSIDVTITEEERLDSTYNPAYMGAGVDEYGNPVSVTEGDKGQIANEALIRFHEQYQPKLHTVTDGVYMTNSYGLANTTMIEGDTGIIIIDTNDSIEAAQMELEELRKITDKPITGVIYTHWHYVSGTQAYVPAGNPENIPIVANERLPKEMAGVVSEVATSYVDRVCRHHGTYLGFEGEDGIVGCALGPFYANPNFPKPTMGYIPPNTLVSSDEPTKMTIDGVEFVLTPQESDSEDGLIIWMPEKKVCVNNLTWPTMPNMYTLRGEAYRDPRIWIDGLDKIISLEPEHILAAHGLPMSGAEKINKELTITRDAMQYIFDQTVRYINKGYSVDKIVETVKLPEELVSGELSKPVYGDVPHYIRGVYRGLIGWFSTETADLHPVTKAFEAKKIVEGFGGMEVVLAQTKATLEDKQYAWAAQLAGYALEAEPDNVEARQLKADCLRAMGQIAGSTTTRNYYLSQARELEGQLDYSAAEGAVSKDKLMACPRDTILKILRASIDPEKCADMTKTIKFNFPDENLSFGLAVRKGVGQVMENPEHADVEVTVPYETLVDIIVKNKAMDECIQSGEMTVSDMAGFQEIMGIFDMAL